MSKNGVLGFMGWALKGVKAGDKALLYNDPELAKVPEVITVESDFEDGGQMPQDSLGWTETIQPSIKWEVTSSEVKEKTKEYLVILEDPDAPMWFAITHMILYSVDPSVSSISKGTVSKD